MALAVGQFLSYALDEEAPSVNVAYDPRYRKVCDRATLFCFEAAQTDYTLHRKATRGGIRRLIVLEPGETIRRCYSNIRY